MTGLIGIVLIIVFIWFVTIVVLNKKDDEEDGNEVVDMLQRKREGMYEALHTRLLKDFCGHRGIDLEDEYHEQLVMLEPKAEAEFQDILKDKLFNDFIDQEKKSK